MDQPFRMDPAECMVADIELAGIITQDHRVVPWGAAAKQPLLGDPTFFDPRRVLFAERPAFTVARDWAFLSMPEGLTFGRSLRPFRRRISPRNAVISAS